LLENLYRTGKIITKDPEISYGAIPLKPPARTYGDRLLAVGDAAGQTKPTSGGGLYYGLIGADAAAETLAKALTDGDLSAGRLGEYEKKWRGKLGREMRNGYWARRLYERLSDKQIDLAFKIMKAGGIEKALLNAKEVSFDWHSRTIKSLLRYQALHMIKFPFRGGGAAKD
jgi:flavin-dependent dehydrogenase